MHHGEEIVDEGDYSEEADTPEDSTNKQSDSDANDHTINRQVDHSIDDNVQTDQPQEEQAQNKIERVLRVLNGTRASCGTGSSCLT